MVTTLTLLESGRRGTRRPRGRSYNPANPANPKRRPTAYAQFVKRYRVEHPNVPLEQLFSRAADAWHGRGGSSMAGKRRQRRNPDNPVSSNPRKRRSHRRRRNPENPRYSYARRRRNPFGLEKGTEKLWGVSPNEMVLGAGNFIATGWLGSKINAMLGASLQRPRPADDVVDPVYALMKALPTASAAFFTFMAAKSLGLKGGDLNAVAVSGAAATGAEFIGALHVLPKEVVTDGSIIIGHQDPAQAVYRVPLLPPPPPGPMIGFASGEVRANTSIAPVPTL